jgi:PhzF family phenazine biosynthesis protein
MSQSIVVVDAFTDQPFSGNPAAVCVLDGPADTRWMQNVALEMNLSETAFLHREGEDGVFRLRWFTPTVEVDLCGHATLASAHALWSEGHLEEGVTARFQTRSGLLTASPVGSGWIELDFPATPAGKEHPDAAESPIDARRISEALGATARAISRSKFDLLVELENEREVRGLAPDIGRIAALPFRGVIVTARSSEPGHDFVSRFFAPRVGVNEDPVCGSAHCCLAPYWADRLGKAEMTARQVSPRGGVVRVAIRGDRVRLAGRAVTTLRGHLNVEVQ